MCHFVSWIELNGKEYFLTNAELETKEGNKLLKSDVKDDLCGHGAILAYYPELKDKGFHKECENFSSQTNFPGAIAKALKNGLMSRIGINKDMLTAPALAEYTKVEAKALAEYTKVEAKALAEYQKVEAKALAEYQKVKAVSFTNIVKQKRNRNTNWK